jgi:F-type H+-transporting ATPase subunit alpha
MTELLKQGQYQPLPVERQVLILFAVTNGFTDTLPIDSLQRYERELYAFVDARHAGLWNDLRTKGNDGKAWDGLVGAMKSVLGEFGKEFAPEAKAA